MENVKKVALVAINSRSSHTNLALYYIKKLLNNNAEADCRLLELTINENWKNSLGRLTEEDFDYYLFSVYIWNCDYIENLIGMLKKINPRSRIILGGPEVSYNREKWLNLNVADTIVIGQAENFIPQLFTFKEQIFNSESTPINQIPFPYEPEDYENLADRLVYYEASRGCLFSCSYCLSSCSDQKLEYRDIERVKEEMKLLISIKPKIVKMVDRTFNSEQEYAREIWDFLISEKSPVPFHFEIHPLYLDNEDFEILKKAPVGLFNFEVGIQSTNKNVLTSVDRPYNWHKEKKNIKKLCSLKNIHTHLDQIVGLPLDTEDIAEKSFNDILALEPDEFQMGFLKILPGTSLSKKTGSYEMIVNQAPPYEVIQTSTMNYSVMKDFYMIETDLNRYYNSHYFKETLSFLMDHKEDSITFFKSLQDFSPVDKSLKRWPVLGQSLMQYTKMNHSEEEEYVFDLLRLDWCPFASGQTFPPFLKRDDKETIKELRRNSYPLFLEMVEDFTRRDFNHSILYVPESKKMKEKLNNQIVLFYRTDTVKKYTLPLNTFE